jgi:hypothetical protein
LLILLVCPSGSGLPEFAKSKQRLSAPRLLRMHRAAAYVAEKLGRAILRAVDSAAQPAAAGAVTVGAAAGPGGSPASAAATPAVTSGGAAAATGTAAAAGSAAGGAGGAVVAGEEAPLDEDETAALAPHIELLCGTPVRPFSRLASAM